jgi:hypothetical protein
MNRKPQSVLTGGFCTSGSKGEFTLFPREAIVFWISYQIVEETMPTGSSFGLKICIISSADR